MFPLIIFLIKKTSRLVFCYMYQIFKEQIYTKLTNHQKSKEEFGDKMLCASKESNNLTIIFLLEIKHNITYGRTVLKEGVRVK